MNTEPSADYSLRPLMMTVLVAMLSMMAFTAMIGPISRALGMADWQAGAVVTCAGITWMLSSRAWGVASDRQGRKPVALIGIGGFALAYLALAIFLQFSLANPPSVWLAFAVLVVLRSTMGGFYAAVPAAANAYVADHTPPERRAASMAALGAASALGLTLGPALAALLSARGLMTPLYITALLPLLAGIALALTMKDSGRVGPIEAGPRLRLADPRLRVPMVVSFLAMASVSIAQIVVGFYAIDRLGLASDRAAQVAGIALSGVGVALVLAQVLVQKLKASPAEMMATGLAVASIGFGSAWAASSPPLLWASYATAAFGMGFVFPSFSALASSSVSAREQGAAQGSISASQGLGVVIGPSLGTALYELSPVVPYLFASVMLALTAVWVWRRKPSLGA